MLKTFVTLALTLIFWLASTNADAATNKTKRKIAKTTDGKFTRHYSKSTKKYKSKKSKRYAKYKKNKGGSSVDLRALTTESPYTDNPETGVNSVETKPGIQ